METRAPTTGSTAIAMNVSAVRIKTERGIITHEYDSEDTILQLKRAIEADHGHPVGNQELSYSGGVPGDPVEQVGNARFVWDFANMQGVLRLQVNMSRSTVPVEHLNTISDVKSTDSTVWAGDEYSEEAFRIVMEMTKQPPKTKNEVRGVTADSKSVVKARNTFGKAQANGNDRALD